MSKRTHHLGTLTLVAALGVFWLVGSAKPLAADSDDGPGISRTELGRLDLFLDSHPDVAQALDANPSLATNRDFLTSHPAWRSFLEDHAGIRDGLIANPSGLMQNEAKFDALEAKSTLPPRAVKESMTDQFGSFDKFLDQHPAIAKQLEANPSLIRQKDYVADHPELEAFLKNKPTLRDNLVDNPNAFMKGVATVDAADQPPAPKATMPPTQAPPAPKATMPPTQAPPKTDNDSLNRSQIGALDSFLDANPGLTKQLQANPSLIDNASFVKDNPDLAGFLQNHPDLAEDWRSNPALTMTDMRRMNQIEAARAIGGERSVDVRSAVQNFDNFLDNHPLIAADIDHHSSLAANVSFIDAHPELKAYLQKNPGVAAQLKNNPQSFMTLLSQFDKKETPRIEKKEDLKPKMAKLNH